MERDFEKMPFEDDFPVRIYVERLDGFRLHWQYDPELLLVVKGSMIIQHENIRWSLRTRQMTLLDGSQHYMLDCVDQESLFLGLQFNADFFQQIPDARSARFRHEAFAEAQAHDSIELDELRALLVRILRAYTKRPKGYRYQIVSTMFDALGWLDRHDFFEHTADPGNPQDMAYQRVKAILEYINENSDQPLSLKEIAQREHISYYYLSSIFKRFTGLSFREHLNNIRLYKSIKSLRNSKESLEMIAARYGFSSARSYASVFLRTYGISPSDYRSRHRTKSKESPRASVRHEEDMGSIYELLNATLPPRSSRDVWSEMRSIELDLCQASGMKLDRPWENILTCSRAADLLRSSTRELLERVQRDIGFRYLRFHGLFCDDMMILVHRKDGSLGYNWVYVDQVLDFMRGIHLKPYIEFSFMPTEMASGEASVFWYGANITPPREMSAWGELVLALFKHCVARYGIEEVSEWYVEVWSQPDYAGAFWTGTMDEYFQLYEASARAVKAVSPATRVGGPAISSVNYAQTRWIQEFCLYCKRRCVPVDFISFHAYVDLQTSYKTKGRSSFLQFSSMAHLREEHEEKLIDHHIRTVAGTGLPVKEFHVTEWNPSPRQRFCIRDTAFMAPFVVRGALQGVGRVKSMAFWTLSDLTAEVQMPLELYHGGMGMFNHMGIPKPSYLAFLLMHKLGDEILAQDANYIVTRHGEDIQILAYNIAYLDQLAQANTDFTSDYEGDVYSLFEERPELCLKVRLRGGAPCYRMTRYRLDRKHGSAYDRWVEMGTPRVLDAAETEYLRETAKPEVSIREVRADQEGIYLECSVPVQGCILMLLSPVSEG